MRYFVRISFFGAFALLLYCAFALSTGDSLQDNGMGLGVVLVGAAAVVASLVLLGCAAWLWVRASARWPLWLILSAGGGFALFALVGSVGRYLRASSSTEEARPAEALPATVPEAEPVTSLAPAPSGSSDPRAE
jgi:hypothetical protein